MAKSRHDTLRNMRYTQLDSEVAPGGGPPAHIHHREDETWYVVEGSFEMRIGDATLVARPRDYIRGPRGTVHAFRNVGERTARMLTTFVPSGIEDFFMEVYQPVADRTAPPERSCHRASSSESRNLLREPDGGLWEVSAADDDGEGAE